MTTKLFKKDKTGKKKDHIKQVSTDGTVTSMIVSVTVHASEGLYKKLALHQTNIMHEIEIITNSLDQVYDSDKAPKYSDVITQLLQQLDMAVSTTQKCLTKDVFEKNPSLKSTLDAYNNEMYANVALLVKWADFASRDSRYTMNREYIFYCVTRFKDALNNIVKIVSENVIGATNNPNMFDKIKKSSSLTDGLLHRTGVDIINGSATLPLHESNHHHHLIPLSTPGVPTRSQSVKPRLNVSHDSLNSDSGDSDIINRRSDSTERHDVEAYNPHYSENGLSHNPVRKHSSPGQMENHSLMANGDAVEERPPPIPVKKRKQQQQQYNLMHQMSYSPHTSPTHSYHQHSNSLPVSMSTAPPRQSLPRKDYDDVPPPLPTKKSARSATVAVGALAPPPLPLRVDSIPGFRSKLEHGFHAPPPPSKPPRSDGDMNPHQPPGTGQPNLLYMIDHYNKTIQHPARGNDEQAPPIPPKRRTVMIYNQLIQASNYTFDESTIPSLNIPDMVAPPPIPAKKRNKKPLQPVTDSRESVQLTNGSPHHSISSSNSQDLSGDAEEKVNYLEIDDASPYLSFEQEETGWTLKGGEIDALIAYAASSKRAVKQFTEAFLSTYYTFITPDELIFKLLLRLHNFYKVNNVTVWQTTTSLLLRVLTNLNAPLIKEAEITLIELIHTMLKDGNLKFGQLIRNALVEKLHQKVPEFIPLSIAMCKNSGPSGHITDFDPSDVAKQLTILDADYFYKVDVSEMLYWAKEHNEEKCPRLTLFTMHFNNVSQWVKSRLLDKDVDWKKREKLMNYFISVMKSLREHGNFNAYLAILSAIESASVSRLDWSERIIKSLEEPRALIDCRGSFKNYRQAFSQTKPPCIPYIGLYLQDLTFLEEQPSKLEDKVSINFSKRWKQFRSVDHIRFAQTKMYSRDQFQPDPKIMGVFNNFSDVETDEKLWERSTDIKPSNRQKSATNQN